MSVLLDARVSCAVVDGGVESIGIGGAAELADSLGMVDLSMVVLLDTDASVGVGVGGAEGCSLACFF